MKKSVFVKSISMVMTVLILLSVSAGCKSNGGSGSKNSGKTYDLGGRTITFAAWDDMAPQEGSIDDYASHSALIEEIEEKYNCKLDFYFTGDFLMYCESVISTIMSGQLVGDAFLYGFESAVPSFVNKNLVVPIDDYFDFSAEQWNQKQNDAWIYNGKHYGITSWIDEPGYIVLFNKNIVEENNISAESIYQLQADGKWTWDKFEEFAIKCTRDKDNDGVNDTWGLGSCSHSPFYTEAFIYSNDAAPVVHSGDFKYKFNLEDPAVMEAIEFGRKLMWQDKVADMSSNEWGYWEALWKRGRIAFFVVPRWSWDSYHETFENQGMEYGILLIPKGPKATENITLANGYSGYFMQPGVENKEAVGAILSELEANYPWRRSRDLELKYQDVVFDDESMETIKLCSTNAISPLIGASTYFRDNVVWTDWGLNSNTPLETFIAKYKQSCQASFDEIWADSQ